MNISINVENKVRKSVRLPPILKNL